MRRSRLSKTENSYVPHRASVPGRVVEYLRAQPDEWLTTYDVAIKFDADLENIRAHLRLAVDAGLLARTVEAGVPGAVYRLGPKGIPA